MKQQHSLGNDWEYLLASSMTSEEEPVEALLVSLVLVESPGASGERWVMLSSDLVLPEIIPCLPNSFQLLFRCIDRWTEKECMCSWTAS